MVLGKNEGASEEAPDEEVELDGVRGEGEKGINKPDTPLGETLRFIKSLS